MSVITRNQFRSFIAEFPEMQCFYPQINSASDREFMYDNFFAPEDDVYDAVGFDENDYEYQQAQY